MARIAGRARRGVIHGPLGVRRLFFFRAILFLLKCSLCSAILATETAPFLACFAENCWGGSHAIYWWSFQLLEKNALYSADYWNHCEFWRTSPSINFISRHLVLPSTFYFNDDVLRHLLSIGPTCSDCRRKRYENGVVCGWKVVERFPKCWCEFDWRSWLNRDFVLIAAAIVHADEFGVPEATGGARRRGCRGHDLHFVSSASACRLNWLMRVVSAAGIWTRRRCCGISRRDTIVSRFT